MMEVNPKHGARYYTRADLPEGLIQFPEDNTCCDFCALYDRIGKRCNLTGEFIYRPNLFVGRDCPLRNWRKEE